MDVTKTITVDKETALAGVKKRLSVIGKRDDYTEITLTTAETPLIDMFTIDAARAVASTFTHETHNFIETDDGAQFDITFKGLDETDNYGALFQGETMAYVIAYDLYSYLNLRHPDAAAEFWKEAANHMAVLRRSAFYRMPPKPADYTMSDVTGTVVTE